MIETDFDSEREYIDERFNPETVYEDDNLKTVLGFFKPQQFIPVHAPDSTLCIYVHEGGGIVRSLDGEHEIGKGDVVVIPAGDHRGICAKKEGIEALLITSPPPSEADHDRVREGLREGEFDPD